MGKGKRGKRGATAPCKAHSDTTGPGTENSLYNKPGNHSIVLALSNQQ